MLRVVRDAVLHNIIRGASLAKCTFNDIVMTRHPVSTFPASKIASLREKHFSIPSEYLFYYPTLNGTSNVELGIVESLQVRT